MDSFINGVHCKIRLPGFFIRFLNSVLIGASFILNHSVSWLVFVTSFFFVSHVMCCIISKELCNKNIEKIEIEIVAWNSSYVKGASVG